MKADVTVKQQLLKLEKFLLQPEVRYSPKELSNILADEFIEFGSSGEIYTKLQIIDALQNELPIQMDIINFQTNELSSDVILATYQISKQVETEEQTVTSLRSSIWKMIDGRWQMVFHQGTLTQFTK